MAFRNRMKTEHSGAKDMTRKTGFWGRRLEAKEFSRRVRRYRDKKAVEEGLEEC